MSELLKDKNNSLIMESMKEHNKTKTETLRAIKTAIMQWETAKENVGKTYDEAVEVGILRKLHQQYKDTSEMCNDGKHDDMVEEAKMSMVIIEEFLPEPVDKQAIYEYFVALREDGLEATKKNMGTFIKELKLRYPTADGKMIADVVKENLN